MNKQKFWKVTYRDDHGSITQFEIEAVDEMDAIKKFKQGLAQDSFFLFHYSGVRDMHLENFKVENIT